MDVFILIGTHRIRYTGNRNLRALKAAITKASTSNEAAIFEVNGELMSAYALAELAEFVE